MRDDLRFRFARLLPFVDCRMSTHGIGNTEFAEQPRPVITESLTPIAPYRGDSFDVSFDTTRKCKSTYTRTAIHWQICT
jgi:hypothetical protein